jgi:hypothetical protein
MWTVQGLRVTVSLTLATFKLGRRELMMLKTMASVSILNLRVQAVYSLHPKAHYFVNKFYLIVPLS